AELVVVHLVAWSSTAAARSPGDYGMIATAIMRLSLAAASMLAALLHAACGPYQSEPSGPQTAAERAAAEREASTDEPVPEGKAWGGWRYQGKRDDCFYVVER